MYKYAVVCHHDENYKADPIGEVEYDDAELAGFIESVGHAIREELPFSFGDVGGAIHVIDGAKLKRLSVIPTRR